MSEKKAIQLAKVKPTANPEAVEFLTELLEKAKSGRLKAVALVGEDDSGYLISGHCVEFDKTNILQLVGGVERLKRKLLEFIED